jgi:hypothetical protein
MIKDALGNTLTEGNLVVCLAKEHIPPIGKILAYKPGGLALPNSKGLTPAVMVIGFEMTISAPSDKDVPIGAIVKVVDPRSEQILADILEMPTPKITEN